MEQVNEGLETRVRTWLRGPKNYHEGLELCLQATSCNESLLRDLKNAESEPGSMKHRECLSKIIHKLNSWLNPNRYSHRKKQEVSVCVKNYNRISASDPLQQFRQIRAWLSNPTRNYRDGLKHLARCTRKYKLLTRLYATENPSRLARELQEVLKVCDFPEAIK